MINISKIYFDVDGVLSDGSFLYSIRGKEYKKFGPHDSDGLKLISDFVDIEFITADSRGFEISKKRIEIDLGYKLTLVSEKERYDYIMTTGGSKAVAFMGDGIFDAPVIRDVFLGIAPSSARQEAIQVADYVTPSKAGEGAVADACIYIKQHYF